MRTFLFVSLSLALVSGCKGKPEHKAPPANAHVGSAVADGSNGSRAAPDIALPHSDGSQIVKTTAKLDEPTLHKLQDMTFQGFTPHAHGYNANDGMMEIQQRTPDHPMIWAVITVTSCADKTTMVGCLPIEVDQWRAEPRITELKKLLPPDLRGQPDTTFEVGLTQLDHTPMIYTYQLGQSSSHPSTPVNPGSGFNPGGFSYTNAYFLYYNDGVNQIRVVAEFKDTPSDSKEKMAAQVPKADLENVAKAFMDVYTHAW